MYNKYEGKDNYGKLKSEYINNIANMNQEELMEETERKIWLSGYANNNPRSDYHWHVDACYDEWVKREGNSPSSYKKAYNNVIESL